MATLFEESFEGGTPGATITTANTGFDYTSDAPRFSSDALRGNLAMGPSTTGIGHGGLHFGNRTTVYLRAYVKVESLGTLFWLWNVLTPAPAIATTVRVNTNGTLRAMLGTTTTILETTTPLPAGQWSRLEWRIDGTIMQLRMFVGANHHGTVPDYDSGEVIWAGATLYSSQIGNRSSTAGVDWRVDDFAGDDSTWVGPSLAEEPSTHKVWKVLTASGWEPHMPRLSWSDTGEGDPLHAQRIGIIGDSLTAMNAQGASWLTTEMVGRGWQASNVRVDGLIGRGITMPGAVPTPSPYTPDVIDAWRADGFDPRVWLFALGTNNRNDTQAYWTSAIQSIIDKVMSGPESDYKIYWIGTGYRDSPTENNTVAFQNRLIEFQTNNSNFTAASYNAHLEPYRTNPSWSSWWTADGIHHTNGGYQALRVPFYGSVVAVEAP